MHRFLEFSGALAGGWLGNFEELVAGFVIGSIGAAIGAIAVRQFIRDYLG